MTSFVTLPLNLVLLMGIVGLGSPAHAASLQRLPDGRVVITAFGERVAFREKDADRIDFFWTYEQCDRTQGVGSTLARWLTDPKVAECLNRSIPDGVGDGSRNITFRVRPYLDVDGLVYPGGIDPSKISKSSWNGGRTISVSLRHPSLKSSCLHFPYPATPATLGYKSHPFSKSPPAFQYTIDGNRRDPPLDRQFCVECSKITAELCAVYLISSDRAVSLTFGWDQLEEAGPQPSWLSYDAISRNLAQSIFIDRPAGDLQ